MEEPTPEPVSPRSRRLWRAGLLLAAVIAASVFLGRGFGFRVLMSVVAVALPWFAAARWFGPWWRTTRDPVAGAGWVLAALATFAALVVLGPFLFVVALVILTGGS